MVRLRFGVVLLVAAAVAGCGRKGPLEPPPGLPQAVPPQAAQPQAVSPQAAQPQATAATAVRQAQALQDEDTPGLIQSPNREIEVPAAAKLAAQTAKPPRPINGPPAPRTSSFLLDPLVN